MKTPFVIVFLCAITLSISSCKKDPKIDKEEIVEISPDSTSVAVDETKIEENLEEKKKVASKKKKTKKKKKTSSSNKTMRIPGTFDTTDNSYSKKYIRDYERYVSNYKKAVESKDMDSFLKLSDASSDLTRQYNRIINILPGEEIEKLSEYMQIKSKQLNELSAKM